MSPEAGDVDSPNLERYREAQADIREMDRDERRGTHCRLAEVVQFMRAAGACFRTAGEQLERQFGRPARQILDEACDASDRILAEHLFNDGNGMDANGGG